MLFGIAGLLAGCRVAAPIHLWQPPELASTVGKSVAVSKIVGPSELSERLERRLQESTPGDAGRETHLVDFESLKQNSPIALVSASDGQSNDVALASMVRRESIDFVLSGEILTEPSGDRTERDSPDVLGPLAVSWRLSSPTNNRSLGGKPIVVEVDAALDRYPDLALASDPESVLVGAAARDTFRLITPWIDRQRVELSFPVLLPGSSQVRRGCAAAHAGRWSEAMQIWESVLERYPQQVAATHNLAIAAAAAQDFTRAKRLASKAVRQQPSALHKQTLVWIELSQRDYHAAFNLADPPEGWFVTRK